MFVGAVVVTIMLPLGVPSVAVILPAMVVASCLVAYLLAADNVSRPLPTRLREVNQPVISPRNVFSTSRYSYWLHLRTRRPLTPQ